MTHDAPIESGPRHERADRFAPWILLAAAAAFCLPAFLSPGGFGGEDEIRRAEALGGLFYFDHPRRCLLEFGGIALRSPFVGGGYPILGDPSDITLSPLFPFVLIFGPVLALKLLLVLATWLGAWGVYRIARDLLRLRPFAAYFSALAFAFSGWLPSQAMTGWPNFYAPAFPMLLHLVLASDRKKSRLAWAGLLLGLMALTGGYAVLPMAYMLVLLGAFHAVGQYADDANGRPWLLAGTFAILIAICLPLALINLAPAWVRVFLSLVLAGYLFRFRATAKILFAAVPTLLAVAAALVIAFGVAHGKIHAIGKLAARAEALIPPEEQPLEYELNPYPRPDSFFPSLSVFADALIHHAPAHVDRDKNGRSTISDRGHMGLTWPVLLCFIVGAFALRRRSGPYLAALAVPVLAVFGPDLPVDFHSLFVRGLPLFDGLPHPQEHFGFYIVFLVTLMSGGAADALEARAGKTWLGRVALTVLFFPVIFAFLDNAPCYRMAFHKPLPEYAATDKFIQAGPAPADILRENGYTAEALHRELFHDDPYEPVYFRNDGRRLPHLNPALNFRLGVGTLGWRAPFALGEYAVPEFFVAPDDKLIPNRRSKGEASFYEAPNKILSLSLAPNVITARVYVKEGGFLSVNQNWDPDFRLEGKGQLSNGRGQLGAGMLGPGEYEVRFVYKPKGIFLPCLFSLLFTVIVIAAALQPARVRRIAEKIRKGGK